MRFILVLSLLLGFLLNSLSGATDYVLCIHVGDIKEAHIEKFSLKDISKDELHITISGDEFVKLSVEKDISFVVFYTSPLEGKTLFIYEGSEAKPTLKSLKPPPISMLSSVKLLI